MPPVGPAGYLLDYLFEFGPVKAEGPLEPADVLAVQKILGVKFKPWEMRLLLRLSRDYKGEMHEAVKRDAKPPWPGAAPMWRWVQAQQTERRIDKFLK